MRSSYGEVFRELRTKKHISQVAAAGGKRAQGALSRFEKGSQMPAIDTFFHYLTNIKVSPAEYFDAFNNSSDNKDLLHYGDKIGAAYTFQDASKLRKILRNLEGEEGMSQNFDKNFLDRIMTEAILSQVDPGFKVPKCDADKLRDYLKSTKYWGCYELRLLGYTSRLLDFIQLAEISERVIYFAEKNEVAPYVKHQIIRCELNILDSFLLQRQIKLAKRVIDALKKYDISEDSYYERAALVYFEARYDYLSGNKKEQSLSTMNAHLCALELYDCIGTASLCRKEIDSLVNNPEAIFFPYDYEDDNE